jgi:hypothetical protein
MVERADGKRSFYVFRCKKHAGVCTCGRDDVKLVPTGSRMSSAGPLSAARKAGGDICREIKQKECSVFLREAGIHDRVRRYQVEMMPFLAFEITQPTMREKRGHDEEFAADSPELIAWNERYRRVGLKPNKNVKTGKTEYKEPWSEEELKMRNQAYVKPDQLEENKMPKLDAEKLYNVTAEDVIDKKVFLCAFPGKHNIMRSITPKAKYIEVFPIPDGTVMHVDKPATATEGAVKTPATRGRKPKVKAEVPEEGPEPE